MPLILLPEVMSEPREKKRKRIIRSCRECLRRKQKCDRVQPCSNCVARKVEECCVYGEQESAQNNTSAMNELADISDSSEITFAEPSVKDDFDMSAFGYSKTSEYSTMAAFKKLQSQHKDLYLSSGSQVTNQIYGHKPSFGVRYHNLAKRLPSETYCQCLIQVFFEDINFIYSILEYNLFLRQLHDWQQVRNSIEIHENKVKLDVLFFPALLFQVLAIALQHLPLSMDIDLEPLKQGKSVDMLAAQFSQFGCELLSLTCREEPSLISIQHDLLRASWLKTSGFISQSWHILSQAVRQAQEIGLHDAQGPRFSQNGTLRERLTQVWMCECHRRLWVSLYIWDSQMAMMLGRPMTIDTHSWRFTPPMNCHVPENFSENPPVAIGEGEKPSAFTETLLLYQLSLKIPKMRELQAHRPFPKDPTVINSLHQEVVSLLESVPAYLRQENPDTTWDEECPFLPIKRELLLCSHLSYLLTLHRAHVSSIVSSRLEAINAATGILDSQQRLFKQLRPQHYKIHSIMFFTFDASCQLATILLAQSENESSTVQSALRCLGQAISRLEVLSMHSRLSKSALIVVRALYQQLQQEGCHSPNRSAEQDDGFEGFDVNYLEECSRRQMAEGESFLDYDPTLDLLDSFDPNLSMDMFNLSETPITQVNGSTLLFSEGTGTLEDNALANDGTLMGEA